MTDWKLGFVVLALSVFVLALGHDSSNGTSEEPSAAKQEVYYYGPGGRLISQQRIPVPYYPPVQQQVPVPHYPPVQQQVPVQYYQPVQQHVQHYPAIRAPLIDPKMFIVFYCIMPAATSTTTAAAPPAYAPGTVCIGTWSDWGTCSANCAGTQSRRHSCTGAIEYQPCNQPGFRYNGWYRATNCYEYFLGPSILTKANVKDACEYLGAKLIHVGLRNSTVTAEIMERLGSFSPSPIWIYIGLEYTSSNWTWLDGDSTAPIIWDMGQPPADPGANTCALMKLGNARSGLANPCTNGRNYICERQVT